MVHNTARSVPDDGAVPCPVVLVSARSVVDSDDWGRFPEEHETRVRKPASGEPKNAANIATAPMGDEEALFELHHVWRQHSLGRIRSREMRGDETSAPESPLRLARAVVSATRANHAAFTSVHTRKSSDLDQNGSLRGMARRGHSDDGR